MITFVLITKNSSESNTYSSNVVSKRAQNKRSLFVVQYLKHQTLSDITKCIPYKLCHKRNATRGKKPTIKGSGITQDDNLCHKRYGNVRKKVLINHHSLNKRQKTVLTSNRTLQTWKSLLVAARIYLLLNGIQVPVEESLMQSGKLYWKMRICKVSLLNENLYS